MWNSYSLSSGAREHWLRGPRNQKLRHFPSNGDFEQLALAMERLRPATASLGS